MDFSRRGGRCSSAGNGHAIGEGPPEESAEVFFYRWREREAFNACLERIRQQGLPMKLVRVGYDAEADKVVFYFFAEHRVDFRELVRDLSHSLGMRIEMRQIGARDEAALIGGVGGCGRQLCCDTWVREFAAVTVRMAKDQGLSLNPSRLAGQCGRLKCCLRFEYATYRELGRYLPGVGKKVVSLKGAGKVVAQNVLKQTVTMRREEDGVEVQLSREDLMEKRAQP